VKKLAELALSAISAELDRQNDGAHGGLAISD